jgi:hypothetical protein
VNFGVAGASDAVSAADAAIQLADPQTAEEITEHRLSPFRSRTSPRSLPKRASDFHHTSATKWFVVFFMVKDRLISWTA